MSAESERRDESDRRDAGVALKLAARRLSTRDWSVGAVVLLLAGATLYTAIDSSQTRSCFESAITQRSEASRNDWEATDRVVEVVAAGGTAAERQAAYENYIAVRAESDRTRDENPTRGEVCQ